LQEREVDQAASPHPARRSRLLGAARLSHVRRPLARAALYQRPVMDAPAAEPWRWQEALIERVVHQTPRVVSVFLGASLPLHQAGQHVDVRLSAPDGYQAQRSYSIASQPGADHIELAIERLENGEVSPYFHEVAQRGDTFEVRGPIGGHFVWRREDGGPMLLFGGGSRVVPLIVVV